MADGFSEALNAKFEREPARQTNLHRRVPKRLNLAEVFSCEETRILQNDWAIRYKNQFYQILKENRPRPKPKEKVVVWVLLDQTMQIVYRDKKLNYEPLAQPPPKNTHTVTPVIALKPKRDWKPPPDHPWRKCRYGRRRAACERRASG